MVWSYLAGTNSEYTMKKGAKTTMDLRPFPLELLLGTFSLQLLDSSFNGP